MAGAIAGAHARHALMAIAAGKHVLVEKPTACTIEEIQENKEQIEISKF